MISGAATVPGRLIQRRSVGRPVVQVIEGRLITSAGVQVIRSGSLALLHYLEVFPTQDEGEENQDQSERGANQGGHHSGTQFDFVAEILGERRRQSVTISRHKDLTRL